VPSPVAPSLDAVSFFPVEFDAWPLILAEAVSFNSGYFISA